MFLLLLNKRNWLWLKRLANFLRLSPPAPAGGLPDCAFTGPLILIGIAEKKTARPLGLGIESFSMKILLDRVGGGIRLTGFGS
jgi:hypothetical protein